MDPSGFHARATSVYYLYQWFVWKLSVKRQFICGWISVFSVIKNIDDSGINLNNDSWAFRWKKIFNSDPMKEDPEKNFPLKHQTLNHPLVFFYRIPLTQTKLQENLRIFLDLKLTFENHLKTISQKTNKILGLLPKLKTSLRRPSVFAIYK